MRTNPTNEEIQKQWEKATRGPHYQHDVEQYLAQAMQMSPVGSRISLYVHPNIVISCRKEDDSSPLRIKWLIS